MSRTAGVFRFRCDNCGFEEDSKGFAAKLPLGWVTIAHAHTGESYMGQRLDGNDYCSVECVGKALQFIGTFMQCQRKTDGTGNVAAR